MRLGESYYNNNQRSRHEQRINAYARVFSKIVDDEGKRKREKEQKAPHQKGPRIIFMKKYKETESFLEAKEEIIKNGFSADLYTDEILQNWIREDIKDNNNKDMEDER